MPFRFFCGVLQFALCTNALTVYFLSRSIRQVIVATFAGWLLLQVGYFGSMLFLIWRSSRVRGGAQGDEHLGDSQKLRYRSQEDPESVE
ncbi:exopolysaccharide production repressor protein [Sinorhizobium meliloti]|uniref:exopolysaccharide production repressor protein n=1 Tax=Rhizobium meliloti TaxID=382 RepID=UPI00036E652B|nr:exopolysaccharide production repressor protein [Sinorhizobium meliloti]